MKKLARETLLAMIILIISGCGHFTSAPTNNVGFVNIEKISDLDGVYKNLGEGGDNSQTFLSKIIWPNSTDITHDDISAIEVRAINVSTIKVTAHSKNGGIVKESNFLAGKDFEISSGQIVIRKDAVFATGFEGAPLLGPVYRSMKLGIDKNRHGKLRTNMAVAGLAFLVIPMAVSNQEDVRFERIKE